MRDNTWLEAPSDPQELARAIELLASDITVFARNVFAIMGWERAAPLSDIEEDILRYADDPESGQTRIVAAFRGIGKTHLIGGVLVPRRLFINPDRKIVLVSRSQEHAEALLSLFKKVVDACWFLQHLKAEDGQKDNLTRYEVGGSANSMQPSLLAIGIGGHLSGKRAHTVIVDDIEDVNNTLTREARDRLESNAREFKAWLYPDEQTDEPAEVIILCTFQHLEDSVYVRMVKRGSSIRCWPVRYPLPTENTFRLAPLMRERLDKGLAMPGEPSCPLRFGIEKIAELEAEGHVWFQMQYMLSIQIPDADSYELRLCDLIVLPLDRQFVPSQITWGMRDNNGGTDCSVPCLLGGPHDRLLRPAMIGQTMVPYQGTKAVVDIAGNSSRDEMALCIMSMASGQFFCRYLQGVEAPKGSGYMDADGSWIDGPHDVIAKTCREYGANTLFYESNADPSGAWAQLMQAAIKRHSIKSGENPLFPDGWGCSLLPIHSVKRKEDRIIDTLRGVVGSHRLVVDESVVAPNKHGTAKQFQYQFARIKRERNSLDHDDRVDALSMAVKVWTESNLSLTKDPQRAIQDGVDARINQMKAKIQAGVDAMHGVVRREPSWMGGRR